ncbi:MAG: hypothetical protein JSV78_05490 [Phycisphaerales bacterium]|nr:MAG: hypothetical protein JSV78_05490 [Phycisphaerales bacterium]
MNADLRTRSTAWMLCLVLFILPLCGCREKRVSGKDAQMLNALVFTALAESQGPTLKEAAAKTRKILAETEKSFRESKPVVQLDPRIQEFAELQAECFTAFSRYAGTMDEALARPEVIPVELWEKQKRCLEKARALCRVYMPHWGAGLDEVIARHEEIIRRLKSGS